MAQEWYYAQDNQQYGPVAAAQLKQMADAGRLQPTDLVWKDGLANWVPAGSLKGLFANAPAAPPPRPAPAVEGVAVVESPRAARRQGSPWDVVLLQLARAFAWDLQTVHATPLEQEQLTAHNVTGETARRYLCWRRSLLLLVIVPTFAG